MNKRIIMISVLTLVLLTGCIPASTDSEEVMEELNVKTALLNENVSELNELRLKSEVLERENNNLKKEVENLLDEKKHLDSVLKEKQDFIDTLLEDLKNQSNTQSNQARFNYYKSYFEPTIKPTIAKELISEKSSLILDCIANKDTENLKKYIHPRYGVRFTPYITVDSEDLIFYQEDMKEFFIDEKDYVWGAYDGFGEDITLTKTAYYDKFVYDIDYSNLKDIGYNAVLSRSNNLENQFAYYHDSIIVEYFFKGSEEYSNMDFSGLRLVFQEYNEEWYLVGIIHSQWTI